MQKLSHLKDPYQDDWKKSTTSPLFPFIYTWVIYSWLIRSVTMQYSAIHELSLDTVSGSLPTLTDWWGSLSVMKAGCKSIISDSTPTILSVSWPSMSLSVLLDWLSSTVITTQFNHQNYRYSLVNNTSIIVIAPTITYNLAYNAVSTSVWTKVLTPQAFLFKGRGTWKNLFWVYCVYN